MKTRINIALTPLLSVCLLAAFAGADGFEPSCEAPPQGASQSVINCYSNACNRWKKELDGCAGDQECIDLYTGIYHSDLSVCELSVMTTSEQLVVWFDGEGWAVAWPGDEYHAGADRFAFSL